MYMYSMCVHSHTYIWASGYVHVYKLRVHVHTFTYIANLVQIEVVDLCAASPAGTLEISLNSAQPFSRHHTELLRGGRSR